MRKEEDLFGTKEWAERNVNYIQGCEHNCKYCYAKDMAIRFKRKTKDNWTEEVINPLKLDKNYRKVKGTIMFPSTHDITPTNIENSVRILRKLLSVGNNVLIVSKPHLSVIKELCTEFSEYKKQILFRFSIGSTNSDTLLFWEPGAPDYEERKQCLIHAYENGYSTSVSCEPMLGNNDNIIDLVDDLSFYVTDSIWLGKMNKLFPRLKRNGFYDVETIVKAQKLLKYQSDKQILKLYALLSSNEKIMWKESIKKVVGLAKSKNMELTNKKNLQVL